MPQKTLYLHIGRHKTGTSSLQQFLSQNSGLLAERGILYPETGRQGRGKTVHIAHHAFSQTLKQGDAKVIAGLKKDLSAEVADYGALVLSSEDFQNIDDFDTMRDVFGDYKIHVICYLREYLSYLLSSFAQRMHNAGDVLNISAYVNREDIPLRGFIQNWRRFADHADFRLYERSKLKRNDIVTDFLDILDQSELADTETHYESNPSLSGNLLSLKMLLNLMGQSDLIPYDAWARATELDPTFKGKIHVDDETAFKLRAAVPYNAVLRAQFPDVTEASFEGGAKLFDLARWDADMARLAALPAFKLAPFFPVSRFGEVLKAAQLSSPALQFEGQIKDVLSQTNLLEKTRANRLKTAAEESQASAMRAKAALVAAEDGFRRAQSDLDGARDMNRDLSQKLKLQTRQAGSLRKKLDTEKSAKAELQEKLKQQTKQADKLLAELERARQSKLDFQEKLKTQTAQAAGLRKTLDTEKAAKTDLQKSLKKQTGQAAKINDALQAANAEKADLNGRLKIQTAQMLYFRGELLREKKDFAQALKVFEEAASLAPENDLYQKRAAQCRGRLDALRD